MLASQSKKVSIITPCYQGESYLHRFLDSLVEQNYSNVELIFINDGSTDATEDIFISYKEALIEKGWHVIYIKQENAGQSTAVNKGLKIFTGDYLLWPDSDDIMYPHHISTKVKFMEDHPQYGLALCPLDLAYEDKPDQIASDLPVTRQSFSQYKQDLLTDTGIAYAPINAIIRTQSFLKVNPQRDIYCGKGGQNFQLLFPMACDTEIGYIPDKLGCYLVRKSSHSHQRRQLLERSFDIQRIWIETIRRLQNTSSETQTEYILQALHTFNQRYFKDEQREAERTRPIHLRDIIKLTIKWARQFFTTH